MPAFTRPRGSPYTLNVTFSREKWDLAVVLCLVLALGYPVLNVSKSAQDKPAGPELPFQIQLLETHIRYETNGDSRKEVHTVVKLNNILGARQFSRIAFDYNRAYQQVDIPQVRISHANGGTSELLPSAVTDAPNPAVERYPAYQDVRVKAVRILGLQEGDTIEYRVITTTTHPPLAPDFWLEHIFDRSGQVLEDDYELDLPGKVNSTNKMAAGKNYVYTAVPCTESQTTGEGEQQRSILQWKLTPSKIGPPEADSSNPSPDILITTFDGAHALARPLGSLLPPFSADDKRAAESRLHSVASPAQKLQASYNLVSRELATADLPVDATGFRVRTSKEILESGYATVEEKCYLLTQLAKMADVPAQMAFYGDQLSETLPSRPAFGKVFVILTDNRKSIALDPGLEVAPFGMIPSQFRGKPALRLALPSAQDGSFWVKLPEALPFPARQLVFISGQISAAGELQTKVKYTMRGDNELLLRVAFHQTSKDKWKDVANLLAISDGFRGQVTSVTASDPKATKDPFVIEYELTQPKFVDWSKKTLRIPALLPQIGLPDAPAANAIKIDLGTPLDVDTRLTLQLPAGTAIQTPAGTMVTRDYATFSSKYTISGSTLTAERHVNFLARQIPGDRAADYNSFLRAVQNDQAQFFTLLPRAQGESTGAAKPIQ